MADAARQAKKRRQLQGRSPHIGTGRNPPSTEAAAAAGPQPTLWHGPQPAKQRNAAAEGPQPRHRHDVAPTPAVFAMKKTPRSAYRAVPSFSLQAGAKVGKVHRPGSQRRRSLPFTVSKPCRSPRQPVGRRSSQQGLPSEVSRNRQPNPTAEHRTEQ